MGNKSGRRYRQSHGANAPRGRELQLSDKGSLVVASTPNLKVCATAKKDAQVRHFMVSAHAQKNTHASHLKASVHA